MSRMSRCVVAIEHRDEHHTLDKVIQLTPNKLLHLVLAGLLFLTMICFHIGVSPVHF
jgi:hypothetical protein